MDKVVFFWNGYEPLLRIIIVGTLTYVGIVILLRTSGKRTLASMNAFDFIITVAMGSAFGRILTAKQVSVSEAITAFILLVSLQYIVSFIDVRWKAFSNLITSQPTLLFHKGEFINKNMRKERIREKDVLGAVRKKRLGSLTEVDAVILETNGDFSVIKKTSAAASDSYQKLVED